MTIRMHIRLFLSVFLFVGLVLDMSSATAAPQTEESVAPLLPPTFFAAPGLETSIYFENLVLAKDTSTLVFTIDCRCRFARMERRRWVAAPLATDAGTYELTVYIADASGTVLVHAHTTLIVPSHPIRATRPTHVLLVGDSIGAGGRLTDEIAHFDGLTDRPALSFVGTFRPRDTIWPHEAYSGWTWQRFLTHYEPGSATRYHVERSPFVFKNAGGAPYLDVARYVRLNLHGATPDFVLFLLGINDAFGLDPDEPTAMEAGIDQILKNADELLKAFRTDVPSARLGVGIIIPANQRDRAFQEAYPHGMTRWRWKRIQYRLAQRMITHFQNREGEYLYIVPTHLNLDTLDGFWASQDAVHPNPIGSRQIAASLYAWLQWMRAQPRFFPFQLNLDSPDGLGTSRDDVRPIQVGFRQVALNAYSGLKQKTAALRFAPSKGTLPHPHLSTSFQRSNCSNVPWGGALNCRSAGIGEGDSKTGEAHFPGRK